VLQLEAHQLQQTLIVKQDELTRLNRDNERLLTEARLLLKEQATQQDRLERQTGELAVQRRSWLFLPNPENVKLASDQIGSPAASILSRSSAARAGSSALLSSALISVGLASNCSTRSLMR
jgi:hypothetical protein